MDYAALKTELQTDPASKGYAPYLAAGELEPIVLLLNTVDNAFDIDRSELAAHEVYEAIVPAEYATLTADEKQRLSILLGMGTINPKGANTRASFQAMFGAGTTTRTNLVALLTRKGSRAESLFGRNISGDDILRALAS